MYPNYRMVATKSRTIIVHKRRGRSKSYGLWRPYCGQYVSMGVNTSGKWEEVNCFKCLKRGDRIDKIKEE